MLSANYIKHTFAFHCENGKNTYVISMATQIAKKFSSFSVGFVTRIAKWLTMGDIITKTVVTFDIEFAYCCNISVIATKYAAQIFFVYLR